MNVCAVYSHLSDTGLIFTGEPLFLHRLITEERKLAIKSLATNQPPTEVDQPKLVVSGGYQSCLKNCFFEIYRRKITTGKTPSFRKE